MAAWSASRVLSGSFAEIWVDGSRIAEASGIQMTIKMQRSDVQIGMDVDSKITGWRGEGQLRLRQGHPIRGVLIADLRLAPDDPITGAYHITQDAVKYSQGFIVNLGVVRLCLDAAKPQTGCAVLHQLQPVGI